MTSGQVEVGARGALADQFPVEVPTRTPVVGYTETTLIAAESKTGLYQRYVFPEFAADGRARYLYAGLRLAPRVAG